MQRLPPRWLFRLFPLAARASRWAATRLTPGGRLIASLALAGLLFGLDFRQTLAHFLSLGAGGLLATSLLLNLRWRPALRVRRCLPDVITAGAPFEYYLELTNLGRRIERDLVVQDGLATRTLGYADFQRRRRQLDSGGNRVDRALGFLDWQRLRARDRGAALPLLTVPAIAPGATVRVAVPGTALRRGWLRFDATAVLRPDPLGLGRACFVAAGADGLLALPRRYPVPALDFVAHRHYQRGGVSLAHAVGDAQEFAGVREYRPGDPRRHIHWRSFARTGRPIVKEFRDEYFDRHALVVDTHVDGADTARFEAVISAAASLALSPRPRDAILDLFFAGTEVFELGAGRGLGDPLHLARWLAEARPGDPGGFATLAELLLARESALASVVLVLAGRDAARQALLDALHARAVPTLCLWVEDSPAPAHTGPHDYTLRPAHLAADLAAIRFAA